MTTFNIGDEIRFSHRGEIRSGRIVGTEDARFRRGFHDGTLYLVAIDGSYVEVHSGKVLGVGGVKSLQVFNLQTMRPPSERLPVPNPTF